MINKKTIAFFFSIFFVVSLALAEKVSDLDASDYVNDFAQVLTTEQKDELSKILGDLEKQTGDQVAVAIVKNMQDETGNPDYIEHYAVKLFEKWGIGKSGSDQASDKGLLFLVSVEDRQMRMEVGYGLEETLTDGVTKNIQDNFVRPEFKNGDYYSGISIGLDKINTVLTGGVVEADTQQSGPPGGLVDWLSIFIFVFIFGLNIIGWLFAIIARTKSWWLGGLVTFVVGFPVLYFGFGLNAIGDLILFVFTMTGFIFDYLISKNYKYWQEKIPLTVNGQKWDENHKPAWWAGGTWGPGGGTWTSSSGGSGFGGFGGGSSGGGGSSSSW